MTSGPLDALPGNQRAQEGEHRDPDAELPLRAAPTGGADVAQMPSMSGSSNDRVLAAPGFAAVADGVGRRPASAAVAMTAVTCVAAALEAEAHRGPDSIVRVFSDLAEVVSSTHPGADGAATLTAVTVGRDDAGRRWVTVAWIGDSPAALLHPDGGWEWLTVPHGQRALPVTDRDDNQVRSTNTLFRAVAPGHDLTPQVVHRRLDEGVRVLVASDGLIDGAMSPSAMVAAGAPSAAALVRAAVEHGSRDEVAVAILDPWLRPDRPKPPASTTTKRRARRRPATA